MLRKKETWLATAEVQTDEAKKEYDVVLVEMRDPELRATYGPDQFARVKDMAKQEWQAAESKRNGLLRELASLRASIAAAPMTREQLCASVSELTSFLDVGQTSAFADGLPILIEGVHDPDPEIKRLGLFANMLRCM